MGVPVPRAITMSSETYGRLKKLISGLKDFTARDGTATSDIESNLFRDLEFVYNSDDGKATQEDLGVVIEQYGDLTQHEQFIQFKRLTAVYERDMYNKFFVPIWAVAMNADKSVGYVLYPKLTPLREVLKDLKESYQTSEEYYEKLNQVLRLCFAPIALAIDALHTPIDNKRKMYHHRDICIDKIYMRVRNIDSSGQKTVEYDDARLKLTKLTREILPEDGGKPPTLTEYYHHADVKYFREPYGRRHDWYSFGVYILEVLHLALPITIQQAFRQIQDYADVSHVVSWILASTDVDVIHPFLSQYLDIAVKCLMLKPNEQQPLRYEIPDEMKQRFLEPSQTFKMHTEYSVSTWTAQLLWMYEESRPKERPDCKEDEVCQACLLRSTERISTKQHGRGNHPKCDEDCQYHCLGCYTNEERLFCYRHNTTGTIVDQRYSYALILYSQSFEHMSRKDTESSGINSFKEEADTLAKALNSKLICGVPKANIQVRPVFGDGTPEDCLKRHCEKMRELIHGDGNTPCSNDTSYTLFTFYFGHSYHGCDKTVGDWCPSFTHTSDDTFEPLRLKRALVHYHMTSIQKCTNYGTSHPECQAACIGLNYLVNPCGPLPGSTAHQWSADKDVSISKISHPLVETTADPCDVTAWFCQMLQGLYHSQCSGKPSLGDIQKRENYRSKCKVPLGKIDVCFKLARYIYEELGEAFIDGECLRIHQKHLKTHNGYTELMVHIDDEYCKPVLAYYKPQGVLQNKGEERVNIDMASENAFEPIKEVVLSQIRDETDGEQYKDKPLNIGQTSITEEVTLESPRDIETYAINRRGMFIIVENNRFDYKFRVEETEHEMIDMKQRFHTRFSTNSLPNIRTALGLNPGKNLIEESNLSKDFCSIDEAGTYTKEPFVAFIKTIAEKVRCMDSKPSFLMFILVSAGMEFGEFLLAGDEEGCVGCDVKHQYTERCQARRVSDLVRAIEEAEGEDGALFSDIPKIFLIQTVSGVDHVETFDKAGGDAISGAVYCEDDTETFHRADDDFIQIGFDNLIFQVHTEKSIDWVNAKGFYVLDKFREAIEYCDKAEKLAATALKSLNSLLSNQDIPAEESLLLGSWLFDISNRTAADITKFLETIQKSKHSHLHMDMISTLRYRLSATDMLNSQRSVDTDSNQ